MAPFPGDHALTIGTAREPAEVLRLDPRMALPGNAHQRDRDVTLFSELTL